jgi:hypothetical protein
MSRPFYFESEHPPEVDELLANRVKALRAQYSIPYEIAHQKATEMLTYFDRYGVTIGTTGVAASSSRWEKAKGATSTQAAKVLLPAAKKSEAEEDLLAHTGMPWDIGLDTVSGSETKAEPHETILGKEILDAEWENFLNMGLPDDDPQEESSDA